MKSLRNAILLIFCLLLFIATKAQQEPQFTLNMFNILTYNPGFAGMNNGICISGIIRQQWAGFKDADGNKVGPETFLLNAHAPIRVIHGGIGGVIMQDKIGYSKTINLRIGYSYHANIGTGKLGIGAMVGFFNRYTDFSKLKPAEPDPLLDQLQGEESEMLIDFSFGLFYNVPNEYYVGLSVQQLANTSGNELASHSDSTGTYILNSTLDRTFYLNGGYSFVFPSNPAFSLDPSILIKTNMSSMQMDLAALVKYNQKFWGGLSYRLEDAISVIVGLEFKNFRLSYAYDITTSKLGLSRTGGSHEIFLNYCFKIEGEKGRRSYKNTRFL